ncbi:MAG: hypothetical protein QS721_06760 [Candidatus Endonucleobacter sp. (ex Gigantidas childressi)]|nr:hypothetical protein [Candidatus Endonucleobacter sp. (ex Gigantidas childressi)]
MIKKLIIPIVLCSVFSQVSAVESRNVVRLDSALSNEITLYPDKGLINQSFEVLPASNGILLLEGFGYGRREAGFQIEYRKGNKSYRPEKTRWWPGDIKRDNLYGMIVGRGVELIGGGLNVPVQGKLLAYDFGIALVKGTNGREYIVDLSDRNGVRLASRESVFAEKIYADQMMVDFGQQKPDGLLILSYLSSLLGYSSQYQFMQEENGKGWLKQYIVIRNDSDIDFKDAQVWLASGDASEPRVNHTSKAMGLQASVSAMESRGSERVGEVLVTKIAGATSITPNSNLQMMQYQQDDIQFEKRYVLDVRRHGRNYGKQTFELERPNLMLRFKADADLMPGWVQMYDNSRQDLALFSGSAWLPKTIKGDYVVFNVGEALAVRVKRKKVDSMQKGDELHVYWRVIIYNDKKEVVSFRLSDSDRRLLKFDNVKGGQLEGVSVIELKVPASGQKEMTYNAIYGR